MYLVSVQGPLRPDSRLAPLGRKRRAFGEIVTFGWEAVECRAVALRHSRLIGAGVAILVARPLFALFGGGT